MSFGRSADSSQSSEGVDASTREIHSLIDEHNRRISTEMALRRRNPLADPKVYIGQEEHYELAKSEAGEDFFKKGKPTQRAMDRALPGQFATVLNMLAFISDVGELVRMQALDESFTFKELKCVNIAVALRDPHFEVLQDKYAAVIGYLKSARKFGLVDFEGQLEPMFSDDKVITYLAMGLDRRNMLDLIQQDDKHLKLIAESNLDALRAILRGSQSDDDHIARQIHSMMKGFLVCDDQAVRAAMKKM